MKLFEFAKTYLNSAWQRVVKPAEPDREVYISIPHGYGQFSGGEIRHQDVPVHLRHRSVL